MGADRCAGRFERTRLGGAGAASGQREHAVASSGIQAGTLPRRVGRVLPQPLLTAAVCVRELAGGGREGRDRKSTRLNSSHSSISYAVFCLKKKKDKINITKL